MNIDEETLAKLKAVMKHDFDVMNAIIKKAFLNGWVPIGEVGDNFKWTYRMGTFHMKTPVWDGEKMVDQMQSASMEKIIFDHQFAKCLWGEENVAAAGEYSEPKYFAELKNLVVAEDRITYLEQFI